MADSNILTEKARIAAIICTVLNSLLFFPVLWMVAFVTAMITGSLTMTIPLLIAFGVIYFSIPLSMPVAIYLMWANHRKKNFRKVFFACALPLIVTLVVFVIHAVIFSIFIQ